MADSRLITRRSAFVGALSTLFIPPALAATMVKELPTKAMTAQERADFHLEEYARAMGEMLPQGAHSWGATLGGNNAGEIWDRRYISYRIPEPEISHRLNKPFLVDRLVELSNT